MQHISILHEVRVRFVYEGHRLKDKVTGAKKVENSHSRNVKFVCSMGFSTVVDKMV